MTENTNRLTFTSLRTLVLVIALIAGVHWAILALGIPVFDRLPYWKYKLLSTPLLPGWVLIVLAAFGLAWFFYLSRFKPGTKLLLFILLGTTIQYGLAFAKGQGLNGVRDRMVSFGHAEFAKAAVEQPGDMLWVAQHYEEVAAKLKYGYIGSKPPGTLLFYMAHEQLSYAIDPAQDHVERLENLRTFASLTWPLISYLVLIPLYYLAREISKDPQTALLACLYYIAVPSTALITLHTDQALYPLLAVLPVLCSFIAYRKDSLWLTMPCGALLYFAVYFSFGLAAVGVFFLAPVLASKAGDATPTMKRLARYSGGIFLGGILLHGAAAIFLKYDIALRYAGAWANHLAWKGWENNPETYFNAGMTNLIEFSVWIGLPLAVCFLAGLSHALGAFRGKNTDAAVYFNLSLAGIFVFLLVFGKTKAEVARLWLFLVPFVCAAVSQFIQRRSWPHRAALSILLMQIGTTIFTLRYQDFS
ncbi:MAG: hypothetical protein KPEEDBHJ_02524 [Anaerolineales bacterium]|nr:hypothetical protein [Anaerolineales bacterium]